MTYGCTYDNSQPVSLSPTQGSIQDVEVAQEVIYDFFLEIVNQWDANIVLTEFEQLFFWLDSHQSEEANYALNRIVDDNSEIIFNHTLKRVCYILVNNWYINREHHSIKELLTQIDQVEDQDFYSISPQVNILRQWLINFTKSSDYQEIRQCALPTGRNWSNRYTSYLLVSQYANPQNSLEQQELARNLSKQLRNKYKFDLAMYIVRKESPTILEEQPRNPTQLGDDVINLIKRTISTQRVYSYSRQADLLLKEAKELTYLDFKTHLPNYLMCQGTQQYPTNVLREKLSAKLESLYEHHHQDLVDKAIIIRTCNRLIEFLTTENGTRPSSIFLLFTTQGHPLTLAIILLKLILICTASRTYLEVCIAKLIQYYQGYEEEQCQPFIRFLEIFNLVFTIFTENVQYHLVKIDDDEPSGPLCNLDAYRLFCQSKGLDLRGKNLTGLKLDSTDLREANLRDADLSGINLVQADLKLANFSGANLSAAVLNETQLLIANLTEADLSDASLVGADLRRAHLQHTTLVRACLTNAQLDSANLEYANLAQANLMAVCLNEANLAHANLTYCNLQYGNLSQSHFQNADLTHANLRGTNLRNADLTGADLSFADLQGADLSGANLHRANLRGVNLGTADCSYANFSQANLKKANLNHTNLEFTDFTEANLSYTVLRHANFYQAQLCHVKMHRADLTRADLTDANFSHASLCYCLIRHTKLTQTQLHHTNLQGANLFGSNLMDAQMKKTKFGNNSGLSDRIKHSLRLGVNSINMSSVGGFRVGETQPTKITES